ncbi:MAG: tRNA threonylcarbamoyladenosine dehydratase [Proteobacteria bacterium]|nr:tRNA threonylcarbamoyladenosine dehydratase [Pseudomonadota bacterium]
MTGFSERTRLLIGDEAVETLRSKNIFLAGLGGVGSYTAEALARAGIGKMTLHDADVVSESNINRQLIALRSTIGRKKTRVMQERIADINPECQVKIQDEFITQATAPGVLQEDFDAVVDAIDLLNSKLALLRHAFHNGFKIYSSMGAGNRLDPTQIRTGDLFDSQNCRLAKILRKKLRQRGIRRGIKAVWSSEISRAPLQSQPLEKFAHIINGTISTIPSLFGITLAGLVLQDMIAEQ